MSVPYTFTNGQIISATQVNANFAAVPTSADLASGLPGKGAALIGTTDEATVQLALNARVKTADLASSAANKGDALVEQSNGETVRSNSPVYIWRQRPSLWGGDVAGSPTQNALRLQSQIDALKAEGGGTLRLVEAAIEIDRPLVMPAGVSVIGPGSGLCTLTNNYAPYDSGQTVIFQTGNFQPSYAEAYYSGGAYASEAKAFNASLSGDTAVVMTASGDAAGFAVGDTVYVFSALYYTTASSVKQPYYATLRKVRAVSGGIVYFDDCLYSETAGGFLVNLRTTTAAGPPILAGGPNTTLFAWGDGEISGLSVSTLGNWGGVTSAAYRASFNDIDVLASRRIWYNNLMVNCQYNNVRGEFFVKAGEMSMNSENIAISNATASFNQGLFVQALGALTVVTGTGTIASNVFTANAPTSGTWTVSTRLYTADGTYYGTIISNGTGSGGAGTYNLSGGTNIGTTTNFQGVSTPGGGISTQENSIYVTFRNIVLNMTGQPSSTVVWGINAQNVVFDNIKAFHGGASFTGAVLTFGNDTVAAGRRDSTDNFANISWSGPCGIHAQITGSGSARNRIAGTFSGTPITSAIRIADTTNKNFILPGSTFLAGNCIFVSGVANQDISDVYVDGGMEGFTNSLAYPTMLANTVANVRTAKTSGRQAANKQILAAVSATNVDTAIVSSDIGTGTLQRGDQIEFDIRCNCTGTNAPKRLNFKLVNVTDSTTTTMASATIPAINTGIYKFTGRIDVTNTALLVPVNVTVQGAAGVTSAEAAYTASDLATKQVRFEITVSNDSPSDTNSITVAKISLSNPRQV